MSRSDPGLDASRAELTRHEYLSIGPSHTTAAAAASAPQAGLLITTLADMIDATDGVLSLREAVLEANVDPDFDTITFAPELRGGTIQLDRSLGSLRVTGDLTIDGDPENRGATSIIIDGTIDRQSNEAVVSPFSADTASVRLEDLTVQNALYTGIQASDAKLDLERVAVLAIDGQPSSEGVGIAVSGGSLQAVDTIIGYTSAERSVGIELGNGADILVERSLITANGASGYGISGDGTVRVFDTEISDNGGFGIRVTGDVTLERSTIAGNGSDSTAAGGGMRIDGSLRLINSTVASNFTGYAPGSPFAPGAGIVLLPGSRAEIVNTTMTGTLNERGDPRPEGGIGLLVGDGADVRLVNSIVDDSISGTIVSNGANIFRDAGVDGAIAGDRLGVSANELFNSVRVFPGTTPASGVLINSGGPTPTVALRDDPANAAIDAADPASAPPVDQRGFLRDAAPDIGAFELNASPPAPPPPIGDAGLVVATLADEVVVDGEVSLREAVLTANALPGPNTITFAPDLRGGTIELTGGSLDITDDVRIDGDPLDGGPDGIVIDGVFQRGLPGTSGAEVAFAVRGVEARLEDLTVRGAGSSLIFGRDADIAIERALIHENNRYYTGSTGIRTIGGSLEIADSSVRDIRGGIDFATLVYFTDTTVTIERSLLTGGNAYNVTGIQGSGDLQITDSAVVDVQGPSFGTGISMVGNLVIERSLIAGTGGAAAIVGRGIVIDGELQLINSTVAATGGGDDRDNSGGIIVAPGSRVALVNSTLSGTFDQQATDAVPIVGLRVAPGSTVTIENSVIDDQIVGTIASNGANTFRDAAVEGATASDRLGVRAEQLFASTVEIGSSGIRAGVLADNGGPTETIALLDDPANPALNRADPSVAPPTDQRGVARDADPDIGAFELGASIEPPPPAAPPLPPLAEKVPLADADILGVPRGFLTLTGGDAAISFVDEYAAFQNSLGVYLIGPDETIIDPQWAFERIEHSEPSDLASDLARPGDGPLSPGDTVRLSELFDPAELGPGVEFGLFLVADGAASNPFVVFDGGTLEFRTDDAAARVTDTTPELVHIAENGIERLILGDIMHTVDAGSPNPLSNKLNPGNTSQLTSGLFDGQFVVAFEDQPLAASDKDFNDALFAIDLFDNGPDTRTAEPAGAGDAAVASLETLLTPVETV